MKLSTVLSLQPARFKAVTFAGSPAEDIARIAQFGYDGVELAVRDPREIDWGAIEDAVARANLEIPAIGTGQAYAEEGLSFTSPDESIRKRAIERVNNIVAQAGRFGAQVIIGLIRGQVYPGVGREKSMHWLREALTECADLAMEKQVNLTLEPINRYETDLINNVGEASQLLDEVNRPNLRLLFDTFHANIEETSLTAAMVAAAPRIAHVHIADSNRLYPGAGHLDFGDVVATLAGLGYEGFLSAEVIPRPDPNTSARETIRHMYPIIVRVR